MSRFAFLAAPSADADAPKAVPTGPAVPGPTAPRALLPAAATESTASTAAVTAPAATARPLPFGGARS
ncbi:hypothetical protein [Streptomyces sp. NPDC097619]|uniref:hypothetical protein n=1 Tax=Streptomyces sp. NPDC097619 TaxID=3157228 RepID=UPI00331D6296